MTVQAIPKTMPTTLRPLRLNFAQVCICCGTRWCESPACVFKHDVSCWVVCTICDGFGGDGLEVCIYCIHGLMEASPKALAAAGGRLLPVDPSSNDDGPYWVVNGPGVESFDQR